MKLLNTIISAQVLIVSLCALAYADTEVKAVDESVVRATALFNASSTKVEPNLVPCTLSEGTETLCLKISVTAAQTEHKMGPWCPRNINDKAEDAGIWLDDGNVYDADGKFMKNLAAFYQDDKWQIYEKATGNINVTDTKEACQAAARPDVDPKYQNHCVQCLPSYAEEEQKQTYLIPAKPVLLKASKRIDPHSGVGLAYNGVKFDAPAPVHAILGAHTIAPFDDCGGHVNPHVGYHYHAVTGCSKAVESADKDHAKMIGYAMDGFPLHSLLDKAGKVPEDLDECRGHEFGELGYHYHVNEPGKNQILGCFKAETGCAVRGDDNTCNKPHRRPPPPQKK